MSVQFGSFEIRALCGSAGRFSVDFPSWFPTALRVRVIMAVTL